MVIIMKVFGGITPAPTCVASRFQSSYIYPTVPLYKLAFSHRAPLSSYSACCHFGTRLDALAIRPNQGLVALVYKSQDFQKKNLRT